MIDIEKVRKDVEMCERELNEEYYLNLSGLKEELNTASIMEKYSSLYDREVVDHVAALREVSDPEEERRLRYLHYVVTHYYLLERVKDLTDSKETEKPE
jgi:hypothetical protein